MESAVQGRLEALSRRHASFLRHRLLALAWASLAGLAALALLAGLAVGGLPRMAAWVLLGLFAAAPLACWIATRRHRFDLRDAARQVERDDPGLRTMLLAAAEQRPDPATGEFTFLQARVLGEALRANERSPWAARFAARELVAQVGRGGAFWVFVFIWCGLFGGSRLLPGAAGGVELAGMTVTPGDVELERGMSLAILAEFPRSAPGEVRLVLTPGDGGPTRTLPMARSLDDPIYGLTLFDLRQRASYRVEYEGRRSREYQIEVFDYPDLVRADAVVTQPAYTGQPAKRVENTRRVSAVQGSNLELELHLNKPVASARLREIKGAASIPLAAKSPGEPLVFGAWTLSDSRRYELELVDERGRTNRLPPEFVVQALTNQPPLLTLSNPKGDTRVSPLQEIAFQLEASDDFGLKAFGLAWSVPGGEPHSVEITNQPAGPHQKVTLAQLVPLEELGVEPGNLVTYHAWAEDVGPDGELRRTFGDLYFAEVRRFEEIFRQSAQAPGGEEQQQRQQQGQGGQAEKLAELQKQVVTATWNLRRRESPGVPSPGFQKDAEVILEGQEKAITQLDEMADALRGGAMTKAAAEAGREMRQASTHLATAAQGKVPALDAALASAQAAYQALLRLQAAEFQVAQSARGGGGGGGGQGSRQRQMDQLEMRDSPSRYQTESQAAAAPDPAQRENLQVLNRLQELARRQEDMGRQTRELQAALEAARTEREREEIRRRLKRLQEEQDQIVQDVDEVRQRMNAPENRQRMAEARDQLEQTRETAQEAAQNLERGELGQAAAASARASRELADLGEELRRETTGQFNEAARNLRQQARDLEREQRGIAEKMDQLATTRQKTLSQEGPRGELQSALSQQAGAYTNLLQNLRNLSEQAEQAEPLLSRRLYETLRRAGGEATKRNLESASQMVERNLLPQATELERQAAADVAQLGQGIERAAEGVLGDEAEGLRLARRQLEDLTRKLDQELASATQGQAGQEGEAESGGNEPGGQPQPGGGNPGGSRQASAGEQAGGRGQPGEPGEPNGEGQPGGEGQPTAQGGRGGQGQPNGGGQPGGESPQTAAAGNQPGQAGGQAGEGAGQEGRQARQGQGGGGGGGGEGEGDSTLSTLTRLLDQMRAGREGNGGGAGGAERNGPITGRDFSNWSDQLRDVEELLQDPGLREEAARIRDRAREMRVEFKRHSQEPQWDLVETQIATPLRMLGRRVAEELARRDSPEAIVPLDRDPVPPRYSEWVRRYYEELGKGL